MSFRECRAGHPPKLWFSWADLRPSAKCHFRPEREEQQVDPGTIEITIDRRGEYAVSGRLLISSDKQTLVRALREMRDPGQDSPRVVITADANAAHQSVVRAMDAAGTVGLTRISITTQQPSEEE